MIKEGAERAHGVSVKCTIVVKGGIIPNEPMSELTREWHLTSEDCRDTNKYVDITGAAMNYAMSLQNPNKLNWVNFEWVWW